MTITYSGEIVLKKYMISSLICGKQTMDLWTEVRGLEAAGEGKSTLLGYYKMAPFKIRF